MERNPWLNALIVLLAIIAGWYLFGQLWTLAERFSDIVLIFFLAWIVAFGLSPLANALTRGLGVPWIAAVGLVYFSLVLVLLAGGILLVPLITQQLSQLGSNLSGYVNELPSWVADAQEELVRRNINIDLYGLYRQQELSTSIERLGTMAIANTIGILTGLASTLFGVVLVLVLSFYMLADGNRLLGQVGSVVPPRIRSELRFLLDCIERSFGGFIRGQAIQCAIYAGGTAIVMYFAGLSYVLVCSLFAGVVMVIPFIGTVLALIPPLLVAALQGSPATFVAVTVSLLILQQVVVNVLAPKLLGGAVGMPPLLVIFAMLLGAKVAGVVGAIFGVPIAAVLYAMMLFLYRRSSLAEAAAQADLENPWRSNAREKPETSAIAWVVRQGQRISRLLIGKVTQIGDGRSLKR